jgi:acyl-CoA synthetase (AMP-forming)/AMP-acid ligase II
MILNVRKEDRAARGAGTLVDVLEARARDGDDGGYVFLPDGEVAGAALSWAELHHRVVDLSSAIRRHAAVGDRALLLFPPGLDFVVAFLACMRAGVVAVPSVPPRRPLARSVERIASVAAVSEPAVILATGPSIGMLDELRRLVPQLARCPSSDPANVGGTARATSNEARGDGAAFLQFTSGSTSAPKGVVVSHANLMHNLAYIRDGFGQTARSISVAWLPVYHDMGLIDGMLGPLFGGFRCYAMPPHAFLQRPVRWLRAIAKYRATHSGGPNFAYEMCVAKVTEREASELDLSSWEVAYNGAEPIRSTTIDAFAARFGRSGFRLDAFYPCYGLAEATLKVSGGRAGTLANLVVDATALAVGRTVDVPPEATGSRVVCSVGRTSHDVRVVVVDSKTGDRKVDGQVGELWIAGPSVACGYFRDRQATRSVFEGRLREEPSQAFLRTGDLGFVRRDELYVTGRLKDLIIVAGRNIYPQDVEHSAERSFEGLAVGSAAAFAIEADGRESFAVLIETTSGGCQIDRGSGTAVASLGEVATAVVRAIVRDHQVTPARVAVVPVGALLKTSSGKIRRAACRRAYSSGKIAILEEQCLSVP